MKLGDKIKELRKKHRLTQAELAKKLNVAPTAVSAWERNENRPLMDKITILSNMFDVPISYFFEDFEKNEVTVLREEKVPYYTDFTKLPIAGTISCGNGVIAYEDIQGYEEVPKSWLNGGEYFFLRAKGDSMINARIMDGDLLLIRRQDDVGNGEIAAVLIDGEAVLKRVYKTNGTIILQSENPKYQPIVLEKNNMKDIRIIGKLKKVVLNF
jgi:repressor LexA